MSHDGGSEGTEVVVGPVNINLGPVQIIVIQYYIYDIKKYQCAEMSQD